MPTVKNVGEPCAGKSHARFDAAAGGNQTSRLRRAAQAPPADPTLTRIVSPGLLLSLGVVFSEGGAVFKGLGRPLVGR
jgi:hypothetical protein